MAQDNSDEKQKNWTFIHASEHKVIFASPEVKHFVFELLKNRGATINNVEEKDCAWVDNPGMVLMNRKIWSCQIDGLKIEIPVSDFDDFLRQLSEHLKDTAYNSDVDSNRQYRTVYGWLHCIAMTQQQYEQLHTVMLSQATEMNEAARVEVQKLAHAIHSANTRLQQNGSKASVQSSLADIAVEEKPFGGKWN